MRHDTNMKKKSGVLSESYIRRLIGPVPKSEPSYSKMLCALRAEALDERSKVMRKLARVWCQSYAIKREYNRLRAGAAT
jgi:hypothetical protein